jgi:hypothetical protein
MDIPVSRVGGVDHPPPAGVGVVEWERERHRLVMSVEEEEE